MAWPISRRVRGGAGVGEVAEVDEHDAEVAVPSGHLGVVATVGGGVDVQLPSWLWLCDSEGPGPCAGALLLAPPGARQAACYCCPWGGQQSAILRRRAAG